jgi:putative copper export protein/methionine-rich copper-binding protein CopC
MQKRQLLIFIRALFFAILLSVMTSLVARPPTASAHAFVIGSDPIDGSTINAVPKVVHINFNSPISPLSSARIYVVRNGNLVDVSAAPGHISGANQYQLEVALKDPASQPQGSYEIKWTAVANADGHTSYGLIGFNVGYSSTGLSGIPTLGPSTSNKLEGPGGTRTFDFANALSVAWDWLTLLALTFWIGLLVMERLVLFPLDRTQALLERARKQTLSLQNLCLIVLLIGEITLLVLRASRMSAMQDVAFSPQAVLQLLLQTNYGLLWLFRCLIIALSLAFLRLSNRVAPAAYASMLPATATQAQRVLTRTGSLHPRITQETAPNLAKVAIRETSEREQIPTPHSTSTTLVLAQRYTPLWLLIAGVILMTRVLSGDAAQVLQPHFSAITFDWLYRVAQGIWFGGLAYMGYVLLPLLSALDREHHAETLVALQRRFRPFHLASMGLLAVCFLFLSEASIHNPQLLLTDAYGRALLVQMVLLLVISVLGCYMVFFLTPRISRQALLLPVVGMDVPARRTRQFALENTGRHFKWIVSIQSWLGAGVLFCAALLAFYAPPIVFPDVNYSNQAAQQAASQSSAQTQQAGGLSATLQVLPGKTMQPNIVILAVQDSNGQPVTDAEVTMTTNMQVMDMGTTSTHIQGGNAVYSAAFERNVFSMSGVWDINVSIQRPNQPAVQMQFKVNIT